MDLDPGFLAPLPERRGGWPCLAADPPWNFKANSVAKPGRNARRHYRCMTLKEIEAMPVRDILAPDATLFMWITSPLLVLAEHLPILWAWGFEPSAMAFVWIKTNADGSLAWGNGFTTRKNAEHVVLGKRGRSLRIDAAVHEVIIAPRREHSRKPDEFFERVERYQKGPRLELFSRQPRKGWTTWGDEVTKYVGGDE